MTGSPMPTTAGRGVYYLTGKYDLALEDVTKSLELKPNDAYALDTRATSTVS